MTAPVAADSWGVGIGLVVVAALLWGVTNPFIARGAKQATTPKLRAKCDEGADRVSLLQSLWAAFTSAAFLAPYIVNQLGSVAATASMTWLPTAVAQPTANALTLAVTTTTAAALGESIGRAPVMITGMALIGAGAAMVATSQG